MTAINPSLRRDLAQRIRWLFGGRITNDEFDDFADDRCFDSGDRAVAQIAAWAWSHYSDTHTYRLRGRNAPSPESRRQAIRACVFLRTDQAYVWPSRWYPCWVAPLHFAAF